ncbi:hypothetical protein F1880_007909 [Penicillium rolfsii]|nr:hypothetical protein F1880_007909 [Penicillium rolfsii]
MLGRLEMNVDECIQSYTSLINSVFGEKVNNIPVDWSGNIRPQYDSQRLKAAIQNVIENAGAAPNDLMDDGAPRKCRVFVCTTAKDTLQVTRLRSYPVPNENTLPATICEAGLATSAATGYFESVTIGNRQFVDGAFGANNPVEEVEEEAADIWCSTSRDLKPLVKCFLSVGTGCPPKIPIDDNMIKFLSKTLVRMATKPESTERRFMARWSRDLRQKRIYRFNVEQGLQGVHMTEYQKRNLIEGATLDYLHQTAQKDRIRECILNLAGKEGKTDLDFDITMREHEARAARMQVLERAKPAEIPLRSQKSPCWVVPFERNSKFVDRELLRKVKRQLFTHDHAERTGIVGLGGVGKTQIALELAYQTKEMYSDCAVIWLPAVDMESLHQAYLEIARQLGIGQFDPNKKDVKKLVQKHLSQPQSGRWLLIIDNADDIDMWTDGGSNSTHRGLQAFLPKSDHGAILFTTRSNRVAQYLAPGNIIEIPEMDEAKAINMLKNSLVNKSLLEDGHSTRKLLEQLTFLPLAIVQAASFINENKTDIATYVRLLDGQAQDVIDLLSEEFEDEGRYRSIRNPVATTWLASFAKIQQIKPLAADCLAFMSFVNAKNIPACLLPAPKVIEREKAIGVLRSYSFVRTSNAAQLMHTVGSCYSLDGRYREAEEMFLQSVKLFERLFGASDYRTLKNRTSLASAYQGMDQQKRSIKIFENVLDHHEKLEASTIEMQWKPWASWRAHIGFLEISNAQKSSVGRLSDAEKLSQQSLIIMRRFLGPDHPHTICATTSLADIYMKRWKLKEAEALYLDGLERGRRINGPDHPSTTRDLYQLAWLAKLQCRHAEAVSLMTECSQLEVQALGTDHYQTTQTLQILEEWATTRNLAMRFRSRFGAMQRSAMMLERRKNYPRVKVLGGLYAVRREPKDESLIREVIEAVNDVPLGKHASSDESIGRQEQTEPKENWDVRRASF